MTISTKTLILVALSILTISSGCNEEFGSDRIKEGYFKPDLEYFYIKTTEGDILESDYYIPASDWTLTFSIFTSLPQTDIEVDSSSHWLTCTKNDNSIYTISADFNNSIKERIYGNFFIRVYSHGDVVSEVYRSVHQYGRNLAVYSNGNPINSESSIMLPENGGESLTYEVRADGEYTITKGANDSWYTVSHSNANNTFFVTANPNPTNTIREGTITVSLLGLPTGESKELKIFVRQDKNSLFEITIEGNYGPDENMDL